MTATIPPGTVGSVDYLPAISDCALLPNTYKLQELVAKDYPFTRGLSKPGHQP
jgi:hypothetical protein